jgi:hypothetical protein
MAKIDKLIERLLMKPSDFTWDELIKILGHFGYAELKKGKTGGSRRKFANGGNHIISLHKPHPGNIMKRYMIEQVITVLKENGNL